MGVGVENGLLLEPLYSLPRPQDRLPQRVILPEILGKDLVDQVIGVVLVHLDLFYDHAAFTRDVIGIEDRVEDQIAENIERGWNVLVENLDVEADTFFGGEGVHITADRVNLARNLFRGAMLRSLEHHVFDEMRDAIPLGVFIARPRLEPNANGGGADVLHLLGDHRQPIRELLTADTANFLGHECFPAKRTLANARFAMPGGLL